MRAGLPRGRHAIRRGNLSRMIAMAMFIPFVLMTAIAGAAEPAKQQRVRDRLWLWTHPAGAYNKDYVRSFPKKSKFEPVAAVRYLGLKNAYFIRYADIPALPLEPYYKQFKQLDRVVWSLTGAGGVTSAMERDNVLRLAEKNSNLTAFIMDDFFHESGSGSSHWLAKNQAKFPVTLTLRPDRPSRADRIRLVQTHWHSGDYRSKGFAVEVSADGKTFKQVASGELPNAPGATKDVTLPKEPFAALRVRILGTHDSPRAAASCGLKQVIISLGEKRVTTEKWKAEASSEYPGHSARHALIQRSDSIPLRASLTPAQLQSLRKRLVIGGRRLPLHVVVYTKALTKRAKHHLRHVDAITLWTWDPNELKDLEKNLRRMEEIAPGKEIILGCYMFDFGRRKAISVERMRYQTELGFQWLRQGRIKGMIFLASPVCDINLKAVEWTREWIAKVGDRALPAVKKRGSIE